MDAVALPRRARHWAWRAWALLVGALGLNCRDSTGPRFVAGHLAFAPAFESGAAGIVDFDHIRLTLVRPGGGPVLDTVITVPPTADSIDLSLTVPLIAAREDLLLYLRLVNVAGDTVFRNNPYPQPITVTAGGSAAPVAASIVYVGVGYDAVAVVIGTPDTAVLFGQTLQLNATAWGSFEQTIPGTPIAWRSLDSARVRVPNRAVGQVVGGTQRGTARIVADLLTGPADTVLVTAQPVPTNIVRVSGDSQTAVPGAVLPQPLRVRVTASDGLGVRVPVRFTALSPGASVSDSVVTSDTLGFAEVIGTLGPAIGPQGFDASVSGVATPASFTAKSVSGTVATVTLDRVVDTIARGATLQYTATARDSLGNPVTVTIGWASTVPAVATVDGSGLAQAVGADSTRIIASAAGHADTAVLYVRALTTLKLSPADTTPTAVADSFVLRASALDNFGDTVRSGAVIRYTSAATGVATVNAVTGMVRTTGPGNGVIVAKDSASGVQATATVRVNQVVTSVSSLPKSPDSLKIGVGGSGQISARALDRNGYAVPGRTFGFAVRDTRFATVSATGLVTGTALGSTYVVDSVVEGAAVFWDSVLVAVVASPPLRIQWGFDSVAVGNGGSISIALSLSRLDAAPVTIRAVSSDSFVAKAQTPTVTVPANAPSTSIVILGRAAGRVRLVAQDTGARYLADTMVVDVVSTIELRELGQFYQQTNFYVNRNETRRAQVFLSDPAPAGGLGVTFVYGLPGTTAITPSPAIIPAGQLSAEVVIAGLAPGRDQVTPTSGGFVGRFSYVDVAPNNLDVVVGYPMAVGVGQSITPYVQIPNAMDHPLVVTASLTPALGVTQDTVMIPAGSYYSYFPLSARSAGTAFLKVMASGWNADSQAVTFTTPQLGISGVTTIVAGDPTLGYWTAYTQDSVRYSHPVVDTVSVTAVSRNPAAVALDQTIAKVVPGSASQTVYNALRALPAAGGDSAWIVITAPGYRADSMLVRVTRPALGFSLGYPPGMGLGMRRTNAGYVQIPYVRPDTAVVTFTHTRRGIVSGPDTVKILPGTTYRYFDIAADSLGTDTVTAFAAGYVTPASQPFTIVPLRVRPYSYPTTLYTISRPQVVNAQAYDSVWGYSFPLVTPLTVSIASADTAVFTLDSATVTIPAGSAYSNNDTLRVKGVGSARVRTSGPSFPTDSSATITRVNPTPLTLSIPYPSQAGRRLQLRSAYVYLPDVPADTVRVALTHQSRTVDTLSADTLKIPPTAYYSGYFNITALDSAGTDTIIASATGFVPDSGLFTAVPAQLDVTDIGGTRLTTEPAYTVTAYTRMRPSPFFSQYPVDTVTFSILSTDSSVIQIDAPYATGPGAGSGLATVTPNLTYGQFRVRFVGSGTARLVVSAPGYGTDTTNIITVTGPTLRLAYVSVTAGIGQVFPSQYAYVDNAVGSDLVVRLARSDSTLLPSQQAFALSTDSLIIRAGTTSSAYFDITGNASGAAQVVARASGYSQTTATVQVGQPHLYVQPTATSYVDLDPPSVFVYAQDQTDQTRIVAAPTSVSAASSAPAIVQPDSASRTIGARLSNTVFGVQGLSKGSAAIIFTAPGYRPDTTVVSVDTAKLDLQGAPNGLGPNQLGQNAYVQLPVSPMAPLIVTLTSTNSAVLTVSASVTIPAAGNYAYLDVTGVGVGTASIIATAANMRPDTMPIRISTPQLFVSVSSSTIAGSKTTLTVYTRDSLNANRYVTAPLTVTVTSSNPTHTAFDSATITIPAGQYYAQTGVAFDTTASYTVTAAATGYRDGSAPTTTTGALVRMVTAGPTAAFAPSSVTIRAGQYVTWRNDDATSHTSTEDSATPLWSSGTMAPAVSFQRYFPSQGAFTYHCAVHPAMTGTVVVNP